MFVVVASGFSVITVSVGGGTSIEIVSPVFATYVSVVFFVLISGVVFVDDMELSLLSGDVVATSVAVLK